MTWSITSLLITIRLLEHPFLQEGQPYGYVPSILGKLIVTFEWHRPRFPELQLIEQEVLILIEENSLSHQSTCSCLKELMRILRAAQVHSPLLRLLYVQVLCDVAHAQGKNLPKHSGICYLD